MNLGDIKDQFVERLAGAWAQFEETSTYSSLRDRFDSLSPIAQKAITAATVALIAMIFLALPWTYFSASSESIASFEERKMLIKKLFRVNRAADALRDAPQPVSSFDLQSRIQNKLPTLGLGAEQIGTVAPYDNAGAAGPKSVIPKGVLQPGVSVVLKTLNLRQAVDLGYQLNALDPATKLVGLEIAATETNAHYFDVTYKFVSFSAVSEPEPAPSNSKTGKTPGGAASAGK